MTEPYVDVQVDSDWEPFHGYSSWPVSRALWAKQNGYSIDPQSLEAGQGWPSYQNQSGLGKSPVPADGAMASAGTAWTFLDGINAPDGKPWRATRVKPGGTYHVSWTITASHKTRHFAYYLTRDDWDPTKPLARDQFDRDPFALVDWDRDRLWPGQFWQNRSVPGQVHHWVRMPHKTGRHVLYAFWWIADTDKAFYQTCDLHFDASMTGREVPGEPEEH